MKPSRLAASVLVLTLLFLLGPFVIVFIAGFSGEETLAFPPRTYSTRWLWHVLSIEGFQRSFGTSLRVGVGATALALLLGVPVAYGLSRYSFRGKELVRTLLTTPLIVPGIIVGLALLRYVVLQLN